MPGSAIPPSPRRGDPSGRPSLFGHSLLPSPSSSPLRPSRRDPAPVKTPLPLSSRRDPAPVKTGGGDPSPSPRHVISAGLRPPLRSPTWPSLLPSPSAFSSRSGAPPVVLAEAGTHPPSVIPPPPHVIPSAAQRSRGISLPGSAIPPSPRRGDPSGRPSLFGHSLLPSPSSSPLRSSREEPALVKTPLPLSSRRDPAPVKTGGGDPSPSPTCHSERSAAEPRNLVVGLRHSSLSS